MSAALMVQGFYQRHIASGLTSGDSTAPTYDTSPAIGAIGATYVQVFAVCDDLNPPITLYAVAVADGAAAPSAAQVIAGTNASNVAVPAGQASGQDHETITLSVVGLSATTAYDIYVVAEDSFANATAATKLDVTTTAAGAGNTGVVYDPVESVVRGVVRSL